MSDLSMPRARNARLPAFTQNIGIILSLALVALIALAAVVPSLFTHYDPLYADTAAALQGPSAAHWFGTDQFGRDLFARVIYGAGPSLAATALAVAIALVVGSLIGLISGYLGGWADAVIMRLVDVLLAIPGLLLSMAVVAALGFGATKVAIAVGIASVAVFARLMRAEVVRVAASRYIEAARLGGASRLTILFRHILPNAAGTVLTLAALEFGGAILAISALSFLGYGAQPPQPEWGSLISGGRDFIAVAPWLTLAPGLVIIATVLAANRISRALDPDQSLVK